MSFDISTPAAPVASPPRTRWAAIIWGAVFAAISAGMIALLMDDPRHATLADWLVTLTPASVTAMVLLTLGGIVLICGAIGLIRRVQRRTLPEPVEAGLP